MKECLCEMRWLTNYKTNNFLTISLGRTPKLAVTLLVLSLKSYSLGTPLYIFDFGFNVIACPKPFPGYIKISFGSISDASRISCSVLRNIDKRIYLVKISTMSDLTRHHRYMGLINK